MKYSVKKGKDAKLHIQVLKNPKWENQIIQVGGINFNHHRPISIDKEEKNLRPLERIGLPSLNPYQFLFRFLP